MKVPAHIRILQEQTERINRLARPAWLNTHEQMEMSLASLRQHLEMKEGIKLDSAAFRLSEVAESHQRLIDMAQAATKNFRWIKDIKNAHRTWTESISPLQDSLAHIQSAVVPLAGISQYLTASERLFAGIDFSAIRQACALSDSFVWRTQSTFANLTQGYERLENSIKTLPDLVELPSYTLPSAGREIFTAGYAFNSICTDDIKADEEETTLVKIVEQESSMCLALLREVNPALEKPYLGAHEACNSENTDRVRHVLTSLRELWSHLLRQLAPDGKVINWLPDDKSEHLHNGKPTRKARILYICRGINHAPLSDFIDHDTKSLVLLFTLLNRLHNLEMKISENQLKAIMLKNDSLLTYILNIWKEGE